VRSITCISPGRFEAICRLTRRPSAWLTGTSRNRRLRHCLGPVYDEFVAVVNYCEVYRSDTLTADQGVTLSRFPAGFFDVVAWSEYCLASGKGNADLATTNVANLAGRHYVAVLVAGYLAGLPAPPDVVYQTHILLDETFCHKDRLRCRRAQAVYMTALSTGDDSPFTLIV
jgi:hypothetical protein